MKNLTSKQEIKSKKKLRIIAWIFFFIVLIISLFFSYNWFISDMNTKPIVSEKILENSYRYIGTVDADPADYVKKFDTLKYEIVSVNPEHNFYIHSIDGKLYMMTNKLTKPGLYEVKVRVYYDVKRSDTAIVSVTHNNLNYEFHKDKLNLK